jgi:hypothetical protein
VRCRRRRRFPHTPFSASARVASANATQGQQERGKRRDDDNGNVVYLKRIPFTDFPLEEISLDCINKTIHLPSEY